MAKFAKVPDNAFDRDLEAKGMKRSYVAEIVQTPNGVLATVYREKIVPISPVGLKKEVSRVIKPPKTGTKLSEVIRYVSSNRTTSKELLISDIRNMLGVTKSNAGVYLSKALKVLG